ncbi:hypothetical protein RN607_05220 [Demequina capsici]|uniref:Polysaccharide chain length determinant N-terminal domain-containing protein n=1 Tax=Demequina capsici TaxID=3075620 RepID=A0AA96FEZ5_9MICO|nr:Wzz/FepE/Etk N-terminal domain-containing protein [Demequina sp. PMTSA13]WNM28405.1 hypothetical protein RN607_05220 [Demequina sp. PMTSA13]
MELQDYSRAIMRSWYVLLLSAVAGAVIGAVYLSSAPVVYEATARLVIAANDPLEIPDAASGATYAASMASTAAAVVRSSVVLEPAARALGDTVTAAELAEHVSTATQTGTGLLTVTVSASDPDVAVAMAAAVSDATRLTVPSTVGGTNAAGAPTLRIEVLSAPATPGAPVSPDAKGVMVVAILMGVAVGLAIAIARYATDRRLRTADDATEAGAIVLGTVPHGSRSLMDAGLQDDAVTIAYQSLRTTVLSLLPESGGSVMLAPLTGGRHDGGVVASLAVSLARGGKRTLLIDLDVDADLAGRLWGMHPQAGALEVLAGAIKGPRAVAETPVAALWVMAAGHSDESAGDLLARPALGALLRWAVGRYDAVVVNAPALATRPDAVTVSSSMDCVLVTATLGHDTSPDLAARLRGLAAVNAKVDGVLAVHARPGMLARTVAATRRRRVEPPPLVVDDPVDTTPLFEHEPADELPASTSQEVGERA